MPKLAKITPRPVGDKHRVIIPIDLRGRLGQRTKWFDSKSSAQKWATWAESLRGDVEQELFSLPRSDLAMLLSSVRLLGNAQAVYDACKLLKSSTPDERLTLAQLIDQCSDSKEKAGKKDYHVKAFRSVCKKFLAGKELMLAHEVQPAHVEAWIHSDPKWSPQTKINYLTYLKSLFSYAVKRGHCRFNPAEKVERPTPEDKSPEILTVEECERLMRAAEEIDQPMIRYLALSLFGGLRPSEAQRITDENIKEGHVEVFGKRVRSKNRRLVTINPTLKAWLERYPEAECMKNQRRRLDSIWKATMVSEFGPLKPVNWAQDALRHSHVSYSVPIHGARQTSMETGHSEAILFRHYRELVPRSSAEKFFQILPK